MSAIIPAVTPVDTAAAVQPTAGSTPSATSGETIAITDPSSSTTPVVIAAPTSGSFTVAPATQGANVAIIGDGNASVSIGTATTGGNPQNIGGSTVSVDEDYAGDVIANFNNAIVDGTVNKNIDTGTGSIAENAPSDAGDFNFYINTGAGNDQIQGTVGNDFIRAGAGNDVVNSGAGNDVVRLGTGTDQVTFGSGDDILYLTVDQLQTPAGQSQTKGVTDFDSDGDDKIQISKDLEDLVDITGLGTNKITISLSGDQTGTTHITSGGLTIDDDDIEFV